MLQSPNTKDDEKDDSVELNVVVGILTYNSEKALEKTVTSIKGTVDDIIVCDNASTDSTSNKAKELGCKTVSLSSHVSDSKAMLSLFEAALDMKADVLVTVAPGTLVEETDLQNLAREIAIEHSDIAVGSNQVIRKREMDASPIKAYGKNAFSKMLYSQTTDLPGAKAMGFYISTCAVFVGLEKSQAPQNSFRRAIPATSPNKSDPLSIRKTRNSGVNKIFILKGQPLSISFLFKNIWFLRTLMLASGMIISILLLAYTFIFLNTFKVFGSTTSYFPWNWQASYVSSGAVMSAFWVGIAVSVIPLILSGFILLKWVLPELSISFGLFKRRLQVKVQSASG